MLCLVTRTKKYPWGKRTTFSRKDKKDHLCSKGKEPVMAARTERPAIVEGGRSPSFLAQINTAFGSKDKTLLASNEKATNAKKDNAR